MLALLLFACGPRDGAPAPPPATDTAGDTAADTATGPSSPLSWTATLAAPDLEVEGCGSTDDMGGAIAGDGDLDGDGLPELAVGAPGHDELGVDFGAVYVFLGARLSGAVDVADAHAVVRATVSPDDFGDRWDGFGLDVRWLGDLDGDGLDELGIWRGTEHFYVFEGARLAAGGELDDGDAAARHDEEDAVVVPWPDLDGDGLDDVALGLPWRGMNGAWGTRGTIALASGTALLDPALPTLQEVYGLDAEAHAGAGLGAVADHDGDGFADLAASLGDELVVLGSAALTSPYALYADDAVLARWSAYSSATEIVELGDADGGGVADFAVWYDYDEGGRLYGVRGEDDGGDLLAAPFVDCGWRCVRWGLARDLDGDGARDAWIVTSGGAYAVGARDLLAGTADVQAPLAQVAADVRQAVGVDVADAADGVWVGLDATTTTGGGVARVQVSAGETVAADAAEVAVASPWAGWQAADPAFADLTGDGIEEMVFEDEDAAGIAVFDGARVAAGGSLALCDADWRVARDLEPVAWLEDVDGDGGADVLLADRAAATLSVRSGAALLGLAEDDTRTVWTDILRDADGYVQPLCDVTGDGLRDHAVYDGEDVEVIDGRAWIDGYDAGVHLVGRFDDDDGMLAWPLFACVDDLDGDGGAEIFVGYEVMHADQLDPGVALAEGDGRARLSPAWEGDGYGFSSFPAALGDLDGDGLPEHAFVAALDVDVYDDEDLRVVLVDGATLAAGGTLDADDFPAGLAMRGAYHEYLELLGRADVDADGLADLLVDWRGPEGTHTVLAVPATDLLSGAAVEAAAARVLFDEGAVRTLADGGLSLGPDYAGTGGPAIVAQTEDEATGHRAVKLIFAR